MKFKKENYEAKIENRNILIAKLEVKNNDLTKENLAVHEENKDLRFENEEQKELINSFIRELYSNLKTDEQKVNKLKELVRDYQSQN